MKEKRCKTCAYCGVVAGTGLRTCDYILVTGHSRTLGMTEEEKKAPCPFYVSGKKERELVRLAIPPRGTGR